MKKKNMYIRYRNNRDQKRKKRKIIAGSTAAVLFLLVSSLFVLCYFHIVDINSLIPDKKRKTEAYEKSNSYSNAGKEDGTAGAGGSRTGDNDTAGGNSIAGGNGTAGGSGVADGSGTAGGSGIANDSGIIDNTGITEDTGAKTSAEVFDSTQSPLTDGIKKSETNTDSEPATTPTQDAADGEKEINAPVRGIYVSGFRAGISDYMSELISLTDNTEVNAMVIDIKNDSGEITYRMDQPLVKEIGADTSYIKDMPELVKKLKEKNIYLIARIVAFKDPFLAEKKEDYCLKKKDGTIFKDKNGERWINPYKKEVWDYLVDIGKEAALLGFDEIQFDYIRFSTDSGMKQVDFGKDGKDKSKTEAITEFTKYACDSLKPLGVKVSADVFGAIIGSKVDSEIVGQDYAKMAGYLDYICPMIYPSHYGEGSFGIAHPDTEPYKTILAALTKSNEVLKAEEKNGKGKMAGVRPWLQDFTASWVKHHISYGKEEVREQIKAVYDAGHTEWILWNGNNNYTKTAFEKK